MTSSTLVRYGLLAQTAEFAPRSRDPLEVGRSCVVQTPRGVELGRVLALLPGGEERPGAGALLRLASAEDLERASELEGLRIADRLKAQEVCGDALRVIASERLFGGERVLFYYTAHERVDVPGLLEELTAAFGLEARLAHVGARQRAALGGGCGPCGRSLCCSTFLRRMEPVSIRLAQIQGLDRPERSAGRCGRLKCCLRYEADSYQEQRRGLPRVGWLVETERLRGTVSAVDVLRRRVLVRPELGRSRSIFAEEITRSGPPPKEPLPRAGEDAPAAVEAERGWSQLAKRLWRRLREGETEPPTPSS